MEFEISNPCLEIRIKAQLLMSSIERHFAWLSRAIAIDWHASDNAVLELPLAILVDDPVLCVALLVSSPAWPCPESDPTRAYSLSIVVLVIDVPLILGACEDGTALPKSAEPDVRVEEAAMEDAAEAFSLGETSIEIGDGGAGGNSALMRLTTMRGLRVKNALTEEARAVWLLI